MVFEKDILRLSITALLILIIDLVGLLIFIKPVFTKMVEKIQGSPLKINLLGGILTYILLVFGMHYFCNSTLDGMIFGLVVYGIFDFTNLAIFSSYSFHASLIDILWGILMCGTVSSLTPKIYELVTMNI